VTTTDLLVDEQETLHGGSSATFSPDRTYRYALTRRWAAGGQVTAFVMLNPSTADAADDDATIRRCIGFARRWDSAGLLVVNVFGLRSTDPDALATHPDPVGPDNDRVITAALAGEPVGQVVAAWGTNRVVHPDRVQQIRALLHPLGLPLMCLGTSLAGHPRHPLYLPGNTPLIPYEKRTRS
jgi:hypothetical protein